jgi:tetratricopeptide (TPR) repeat protein
VDNATKRQLKKQDQFVAITESGVDWAKSNREKAIAAGVAVVVLILVIAGGYSWYQHRSNAAATAFGAAMETYNTPLATPGQHVPPGMKTFTNAKDRAAAANAQFESVAHQYGMEKDGKLALYFAGLTYMEEGQNTSAEDALKKVAGSWDSGLASLAKLSLAQLYQQTGRDDQAAGVYKQLASGNSDTVPPNLAKLQLAEMYSAEGKTEQAREIYAKLKDSDKDKKGNPGPAGEIAAEKLNPSAAAAGPQ